MAVPCRTKPAAAAHSSLAWRRRADARAASLQAHQTPAEAFSLSPRRREKPADGLPAVAAAREAGRWAPRRLAFARGGGAVLAHTNPGKVRPFAYFPMYSFPMYGTRIFPADSRPAVDRAVFRSPEKSGPGVTRSRPSRRSPSPRSLAHGRGFLTVAHEQTLPRGTARMWACGRNHVGINRIQLGRARNLLGRARNHLRARLGRRRTANSLRPPRPSRPPGPDTDGSV